MRILFASLTFLLSLFFSRMVSAQQPDQRIGELVNSEDWFRLDKEYPMLKDSMQVPFLKVVAETMIARNFNHKEHALECLDDLLSNHQSELGTGEFNFIILRAQLLEEMGRYAEAADFLKNILEQLEGQGVTDGLDAMKYFHQHINAIREFPAQSLSRPNYDVSVPFALKELKPKRIESWMRKKDDRNPDTKSVLMSIPVTLHGETIPFHFDTGAGMTFVSEKFVREKGLPLIGDSIIYTGNSKGLRTFIDSLQIGEITVRNIIAGVGLEKESELLDLVGVGPILGRDVIASIGETQICMDDSTMLFPVETSPLPVYGRNMLYNSHIEATADGENLRFLFDTGNASNNACYLFAAFYKTHRKAIDEVATIDTISGGGYGSAGAKEMKVIRPFCLSIGNMPIGFAEAIVDKESTLADEHCHGNIGIAAVLQHRKTTLNFRDMFVKFEK
ncbi:MAG: clan AA aspartic protease [Bacteroidaceae bacterium]|nr:clan AA aspartic protease [Bacteroidaceae bacterium]